MNKLTILTLSIFLSTQLLANSGEVSHHVASISDLLMPAINFALLFGFLFYKLKTPINEMFVKKSKDIEELFYSASKKDKDSQSRLDDINQKFKELGFLREEVMKKTEADLIALKETNTEDIKAHLEKQKSDLNAKINNETQKSKIQIEEALMKSVLANVQINVKKDASIKNNITDKLLAQLK